MKKLKIATMLSANIPIPLPKNYNKIFAPLEIAKDIAEGLAEKGHEVSFFAPKGSRSKKFKIEEVDFEPLYKNKISESKYYEVNEKAKLSYLFEQYLICKIFKKHLKKHFDIIHIHPIDRGLPLGYLFPKTHIVYTLHDPISLWRKEIYNLYKTKNQYLVSISDAQRKPAPNLNWGGTIYNGIKLKPFSFNLKPKNYLLFMGRLFKKKGVDIAIKIALKLKEDLIIVGTLSDKKFWEKEIEPYLKRKNIKYIGYIPHSEIYKYYGEAKAFLMPIQWDEPFGLVMIEAMACGTPVVAFDRGSVREVIKHGKTGFIVKPFNKNGKPNIEDFAKSVKKLYQMPEKEYIKMRHNCRRHVENNFTVERMVDEYEKLYYKILKTQK